jgi:aldehyde:ferredoxin oxidoreductase
MPQGYLPLLEVDLTSGSTRAVEIPEDIRRRWVGGAGLGLYLLSTELRKGLRVTDPDCPVFVLTGPLTGTSVPQSSDWVIVTLNAESAKHVCVSHSHGYFGARLRHAGWDGVILRGQARQPAYLWIDDGRPELRSAAELWGLDTFETQRRVLGELEREGREVSVFCIGQAGENLVEGASVRGDWAYGANQGGTGVAWGAKRLKAIAVCGTKPVPLKDPERLDAVAEEWLENIRAGRPGFPQSSNYEGLKYMGSPLRDIGFVPGKNFTDPDFGARWSESFEREFPKWKVEPVGSWNCDAACHFRATCTTGKMAGVEFSGYGGEVMEELGPNLGIEDASVAFLLGGLIDGYGSAAKGAPRTIAMLMEAFNAGEIGLEQTDGIDLSWGNHESVLALLEATMRREGIGELIAQGLRATAAAFGIEHRAVHMHGVGFNDHDQRGVPLFLFQSQVASGAGPGWQSLPELAVGRPEPDLGYDQALTPDDLERMPEAVSVTHKKKMFDDSVGVCMMAQMGVADLRRLQTECLEAAVGTRLTPDDALVAGERIATLQRLITVYLGYRPEDDFDLSPRLLEKLPSGPAAGAGITPDEFRRARDAFYGHQGWSLETGAPTEETLSRTGLADYRIGNAQTPKPTSEANRAG